VLNFIFSTYFSPKKMVNREAVKLCENRVYFAVPFFRDFLDILIDLENVQSSIL